MCFFAEFGVLGSQKPDQTPFRVVFGHTLGSKRMISRMFVDTMAVSSKNYLFGGGWASVCCSALSLFDS